MLNIQKKRRSWALYFAGFLLFVQLFSLILPAVQVHANTIDPGGSTPTADTSPYGQASVTEKAAVWVVARATAQCLNSASIFPPGKISEDDANSGKWFVGGEKPVGEYTGLVVEGTSSDDNKSACDSVIKKMLNLTGISAKTYLCAMGFTRDAAANGCESGIGSFKTPGSITNGDQLEKAWTRVFLDKWAGGKSYSNMLTSGVMYYIYFNDFRQACGQGDGGASDRTLGWSVSPWSDQVTTKQLASNDMDYRIPWVVGGLLQDSYVVSTNHNEDQKVDLDGWNTDGTNYLDKDLKNNSGNDVNNNLKCRSLASNMSVLADAATAEFAADAAAGKQQSGAGALSSGAATDREGSCEANNGGLAWFGCAILEVFDGIIGFLDSQIRSLLTVQTGALDQAGGLKKAWGIMRNFAYLILVPLMLLMVIGTAVGFGPFDAYTVKKALPRMVSAVIFMSISYYLCLFLINVSNDVGKGIFNLITLAAPGGAVNSLTDVFGGGAGTLFTGLGAGGLVAAGFAGSVTWGVFFSFALVTVVALLIGYVVLVIRQVLIIMLLVLSPLAILVWIFPGNDKLWNIWKTTFTAMLMMFPLIMILIAAGRFFAATVDTTFGGPTGTFIKLIAYIAPYFFIPATFKYGLGVFGNLAGMINDRSRGLFDRQRKFREGSRLKGREKAMSGNRFAGGNKGNFRGALNKGIAGTMNAPSEILNRGATFKPGNWASAVRSGASAGNLASIERTMKENRDYQGWMSNDTLNRAAAETNNESQLRENLVKNYGYREGTQQLDDAVASVEKVRRTMNPEAFKQMTTLQAIAGGTAYKGSGEVAAAIGSAAGNDDNARAWMVAQGRSAAMKSGRGDHGGMGFSDMYDEAGAFSAAIARKEEITPEMVQASTDRLTDKAYASMGGGAVVHSSMKPESVKQLAPAAVRSVQKAIGSGDSRLAAQSLASLAATQDGLAGSSPEKAAIWADSVMSQEVDITDLPHELWASMGPVAPGTKITYQQAIEMQRSNPEFNQMRREYSSKFDADRNRPLAPDASPIILPTEPF